MQNKEKREGKSIKFVKISQKRGMSEKIKISGLKNRLIL